MGVVLSGKLISTVNTLTTNRKSQMHYEESIKCLISFLDTLVLYTA